MNHKKSAPRPAVPAKGSDGQKPPTDAQPTRQRYQLGVPSAGN